MIHFIKNYLSTLSFIGIGYVFYTTNTYYVQYFSGVYSIDQLSLSISSKEIFQWIIGIYIIVLIPYYIFHKDPSNARVLYTWIIHHSKKAWGGTEKIATLSLGVKFFFIPLMLSWIFGHVISMVNMGYMVWGNIGNISFVDLFNSSLYSFLFHVILFFDVFFFTVGYLVESKKLGNEIVSVESSVLGWLVCLICYPPFNENIIKIVGWQSSDYPNFLSISVTFHIIIGICILLLMGIYAFASISLNIKASNLTNRGIVSGGAYSIVRHPAYITKNLAWWLGGLPFIITAFHTSILSMISVLLGLSFWSFIYFLRAITEEHHLLQGNNGYSEYMKKVRYRFIPGVY